VRISACTHEKCEHLQFVCVYLKEALPQRADCIQLAKDMVVWCLYKKKNNKKFDSIYFDGIKGLSKFCTN